ncbi:unnamed protein product, partial [Heterotrigona itama]
SELLLDVNDYEYPRANETLRKIHKELWQEYYECLEKTYNKIGSEKIMYPIAFEALKGTLIKLKCQICISPIEIYTSEDINWYFNNTFSNETSKLIDESDNVFISSEDRSLIIHDIKKFLQSKQAGQYWCQYGDTLSIYYYISIDTDVKGVKTVYPATAPNMPHPIPPKVVSEYNLNIYTTWTKWSLCSKCNAVGKKIRYGYCTLSSHPNVKKNKISEKQFQDYKRQTTENEQNKIMETTIQNQIIDKSVTDKIKMILRVFRNKIPCKSKYLPKALNISDIKDRKTEIMVRYCKIKCPQNVIFEVRDKKGNVIESANNSAGIYSMVQGMPTLSPPVIRTTIYQKYDKKTVLICPGSLNINIPITWKVDDKILNPSIVQDQSEGRIYFNSQMHIIFKSLKFQDTNIYSCWQRNEIVGVIKLNVTGEIELQTNYSIVMVGGMLIIIVFMIVFWRAFQGRKHTFIVSKPAILFTEGTLGKGGIGGGTVVITLIGAGDFGTGVIESFLFPGGINSGGSTLGIYPFEGCKLSKSWSYLALSEGLIDQSPLLTDVITGTFTIFGGGNSIFKFDILRSLPAWANAQSFRATKRPDLSNDPRDCGSAISHILLNTTSLSWDFLRNLAASIAPIRPYPFGSTFKYN